MNFTVFDDFYSLLFKQLKFNLTLKLKKQMQKCFHKKFIYDFGCFEGQNL